ncbi:MAG: SMC-Scp complex subunit ScpB [Oscillospiraceae bacterium]
MEIKEIKSIIESILFAAGDAISIEKIADIVDVDRKSLSRILADMMEEYDSEMRGLQIIRLGDCYQFCTRGEYKDYIAPLAEPRRKQSLSNAAIEVLSIIAYKQPVTRSTIEHIRGVSCDYIVNRLIERSFIEEVGRLDAPGRPILFGTTQEFLRCFGIADVSELPEFEELGDEIEKEEMENIEAEDSHEREKEVLLELDADIDKNIEQI